jgi:UDP-glucuronate decarboxylase
MPKKVLITGGNGFIGKNIIKNLLQDSNVEIVVFDNFISSNKEDFEKFKKKYDTENKVMLYEYDITDLEKMMFVKYNFPFDEIYHLASLASPPFYKKFPLETLDVGYTGTKNVLEIARYQSSRGDGYTQNRNVRVLFSSTSEVYGDPEISPQHEDYKGNVNSFGIRACYSDDTEILTENGYKLFSELNYSDKVATLNSENELEYNIPDEIIKEEYVGEMYHFKNWNIDLNVTPNHKMYVKRRDYNTFELLPADSKFSWDRAVLKKTCGYVGKEQEWFYFPENLKGLKNQKTPFVDKIKMDLWLEFMGYYLSEGSTRISKQKKKSPNGKIYECGIFKVQISQSETVKPLNFEKIKKCLDKMPFNYNISRAGNSYFVISNKQLAHYLIQFGKSKDKFIPTDLLSLSKRQLNIILDALILGDGTRKHNSNIKTYFSSSYKLMSNIQDILLKIGTFGNILKEKRKDEDKKENKMYYMTINSRSERDYTYSKPIINNYNGYVYCVNVKNHVIFVRRNGKGVFCGNCYDESKRVAEALCYTYINSFGLDIKIARIFNTYGEAMMINDGRIVTESIRRLLNGTTLKIYGDGNQTRSICHVSNTVNMLVKLMASDCNIPVNIGNDEELTINRIVDTIEEVYQENFDKECKLKREYIPLTQDDPLKRQPCLKRNKEILGEQRYISIKEGILKTINYFVNN